MARSIMVAVAAMAAALSVWGIAFGQEPAPAPTDGGTAVEPCVSARQLLAHKNWREAHPLAGKNICEISPSKLRKLKTEFHTYREYRQIAKLPGFHEGDPYLEYLPLPAYVVACETRGYRGEGRWHAGTWMVTAWGPAQVMPEWNPPNIRNNQDKLRYWKLVDWLRNDIHTHWDCG